MKKAHKPVPRLKPTQKAQLFDLVQNMMALQGVDFAADDMPEFLKKTVKNDFPFASFDPFGFPQFQRTPFTQQLSNADTLFFNLRWYLVSNFWQILSQLYTEIGLVKTLVDVPVDDALRGGIEIKSKQLSEEEIEELQTSLDRDDDVNTVGTAAKWNRLFGGAGVIILTDQDPSTELRLEDITEDSSLEFRAVDMWELFWDKQNTEGYDPQIQMQEFDHYSYYGEKLHKSRVMRLKGMVAPSFLRPRLRGWGVSVVEILVRSINQYLKGTNLAFEVLDEFKVDVYKIKNLVNSLLTVQGFANIQKRVQVGNQLKNYQHALVMDAEDDYATRQITFQGIAEAMQQVRMQVASDMRMPLTKLFGISAAGFNSGEDDIEVYNGMVESEVRGKIKYSILRVLEIKCQKLFGMVPDDLSITFKPLRVLSAEQEENVKTQQFNRLLAAAERNKLSDPEFRQMVNRAGLFPMPVDVDALPPPPAEGELEGLPDTVPTPAKLKKSPSPDNPRDTTVREVVKEGRNDPAKPKDLNDPGANRQDTRTSRAFSLGGKGVPLVKPKKPSDLAGPRKARKEKIYE